MTKMSVPNQTNEIRLMTRVEERGERKKQDNKRLETEREGVCLIAIGVGVSFQWLLFPQKKKKKKKIGKQVYTK